MRGQYLLIGGWMLFLAISSAATLTLPIVARLVINHGIQETTATGLDKGFIALLAISCILAATTALRYFCIAYLGYHVGLRLSSALYSHLLTFDQAFYEQTPSGELVSRLSADTAIVQTVVGTTLSLSVRNLVLLAGSSVMLVVTSPNLAVLTALVVPAVVVPIVFLGRRIKKLSRKSQDRVADASATASESLGAIHTIQAYTRETWEHTRYSAAVTLALSAARERIRMTAVLNMLVVALSLGAFTLVLWVGAKSVIDGRMNAGALAQFVLYAILASSAVTGLTDFWGEFLRCTGAASRISELLDTCAEIRSPASPARIRRPISGVLRFEHVTFC
jgi:ATP-binding cassette, subfamily B, bacterial